MERVMVFIDGSNLYMAMKDVFGHKSHVDLKTFPQRLVAFQCSERQLVRTYFYDAPRIKEDNEQKYRTQQRFFDQLSHIPYFELKLGRLQKRRGDIVQKGVDVQIATDMLSFGFNNLYDTAILVSADGDFAPVMQRIKELGKHVENSFFISHRSYHLQQTCDRFIDLESDEFDIKECMFFS